MRSCGVVLPDKPCMPRIWQLAPNGCAGADKCHVLTLTPAWQDPVRDNGRDHDGRPESLPEDFLLNDAAFVPLDAEAEFMGLLAHVEVAGGSDGSQGFERVRLLQSACGCRVRLSRSRLTIVWASKTKRTCLHVLPFAGAGCCEP